MGGEANMIKRVAVVIAGLAVVLGLAAGTASAGTRGTGVPASPDMTHDGIHLNWYPMM
jgi:hypothetical protein